MSPLKTCIELSEITSVEDLGNIRVESDHRWLEVETLFYSGRYNSALIAAQEIYTKDLCTAPSVRTLVTEVQEVRLEIISELLFMNDHFECGSIVLEWLAKKPNGEEHKSR